MTLPFRDPASLCPSLLEHLNAGVVIHGPGGEVLYCNAQASELLGMTLEAMQAGGLELQLVDEAGSPLPPARHPLGLALATGRPVRDRLVGLLRPPSGEQAWGLVSAIPQLGPAQKVLRVVVTWVDLTRGLLARQRAEDGLEEARARLRLALDSGHMGVWDWHIAENVMVWDGRMLELYGLPPDHPGVSLQTWQDGLYPPDLPAALAECEAAVSGARPYDTQFRVQHPDGGIHWLKATGMVLRDAAGAPLRMIGVNWDITAQKRDAQALERDHFALEHASDAVFWCDPEGRLIWANEAATRQMGYTLAEFQAMRVPDLSPRFQVDRWPNFIQELRRSGALIYPTRHRRKDGSEIQVEISVNLVVFGEEEFLCAFTRDLTERRRAELEIERLTGLLKESQAIAQVGGWEIDLLTNTLFWTEETYRLHDTTPAEYTPTLATAIRFYAPDSLPIIQRAVEQAMADGSGFDLELELITVKGRHIWVHTTSRAVRHQGAVIRIAGAFQDITEQKRQGEERLKLEGELMHAQKLESLGGLASGIAHDLNNVLAAILGLSSTLQAQHAGDEDLATAMGTIQRAAARGKELVAGLTNFSRKELHAPRGMDLNELVRNELELLQRTTRQRVQVLADLEEGLPLVLGERGFLGSALMNLCVNALDAMPDGGSLTLRTRSSAGGFVDLEVVDTGQGMPPEVQARALEPFFTTKPMGKGTGLGLSMVYGTMKAHGGSMEILTQMGQGTRVVLRFPVLPASAEEPAAPPAPATPANRALRILLVDDDELIRASTPLMLQLLGHKVLTEASAREALAALEGGLDVQLVIMDHNMPEMSGADALPRMTRLRPGLPILIATGYLDSDLALALERFPGVSAIVKPFTLEEIQVQLNRVADELYPASR